MFQLMMRGGRYSLYLESYTNIHVIYKAYIYSIATTIHLCLIFQTNQFSSPKTHNTERMINEY